MRISLAMNLLGVLLALAAPVARAAVPTHGMPMTGVVQPELAPLDELMVSFITDHAVPGAALAVAKDGRLLYARGFGYGDIGSKIPVQPGSLFRIASLSKPITATAVLQLVEAKKLRLGDPVLALLTSEKPGSAAVLAVPAGAKVDPLLEKVTVLDLLHHTGGWDSARSGDPMFQSVRIAEAVGVRPPAMPGDILRYVFGRPLDFDPGTSYVYSNFGYSVLGRVIEKASGQSYEAYVREHVLAPLGLRDMRLGKTLREGRAPGEVRYYDERERTGPCVFAGRLGEDVPLPYGAWCLEAMDSHGGWLASAPDLVRFGAAFDNPETCPLLKAEGLRTMFARPAGAAGRGADGKPAPAYYACGWMVRPIGLRANTWHAGALDGTSTLLVRRHDGLTWAVLFNTRTGNLKGKDLAAEIDPLVHEAVGKVKEWPRAAVEP